LRKITNDVRDSAKFGQQATPLGFRTFVISFAGGNFEESQRYLCLADQLIRTIEKVPFRKQIKSNGFHLFAKWKSMM
jgi:hypothetical protein